MICNKYQDSQISSKTIQFKQPDENNKNINNTDIINNNTDQQYTSNFRCRTSKQKLRGSIHSRSDTARLISTLKYSSKSKTHIERNKPILNFQNSNKNGNIMMKSNPKNFRPSSLKGRNPYIKKKFESKSIKKFISSAIFPNLKQNSTVSLLIKQKNIKIKK